ncbi:MAG: preprotein translocase subunit SecE [Verrucomicrobia bacterium]|nr:MAG: preprotein translocase subunit SecE [Verrucomicrobiota bacterium]
MTKILIWIVVVGVVFGLLWWQGQIQRIRDYVAQTREELRKCTWPSWDELKGSTVVVLISVVLLSVFTVGVDQLLFLIFFKL